MQILNCGVPGLILLTNCDENETYFIDEKIIRNKDVINY